MSTKQNNSKSVIGFLGLLTIVFIVLKLVGVINWSWLWVLCPLWAQVVCLIVTAIIIGVVKGVQENKR